MSEVTYFFATPVEDLSSLRMSLEAARIQAVLDVPDPDLDPADHPSAGGTPETGEQWLAFASPSNNREPLREQVGKLLEVFDDSGSGWSLSLFLGDEELTLRFPEPDPARDRGAALSAGEREWLQRFFECSVERLLPVMSFGCASSFCEAAGIPFLELIDQDTVPWEEFAAQFPGRYVIDSTELYD